MPKWLAGCIWSANRFKLGDGTARRGHLFCKQDIRRVRISYPPPYISILLRIFIYDLFADLAHLVEQRPCNA